MDLTPQRIFEPVLHTERLTCTLFDVKNKEDVDMVVTQFNINIAALAPSGGVWTHQDIRRLTYSTMMKPADANGRKPKDACVYLVHLGNTPGERIGFVTLCRRTPDVPMDFGYVFGEPYREKGYGTEAAARVLKYWHEEFGLKDICLVTDKDNVPARKLAERIGFVEGGFVKQGDEDAVAYVLPGMKKLEGQAFGFWGDGEVPDEDY